MRNTIRKIAKHVVTFDGSGTAIPVAAGGEPNTKRGHGPSARGPPLGERLLTVQEVAELLNCSVSALKLERRVRYRTADLAAYIAASTRQSTSQKRSAA